MDALFKKFMKWISQTTTTYNKFVYTYSWVIIRCLIKPPMIHKIMLVTADNIVARLEKCRWISMRVGSKNFDLKMSFRIFFLVVSIMSNGIFFCNIINKQTVFLIPNFRIWYQLGLSTNLKYFSFYLEKTWNILPQ